MVRRSPFLAAIALLGLAGCHAGPPPKVAKAEAPITQSDISAARFIATYNKNADAIQALKASPKIVVYGEKGDREASVSGHLALERDKNFRLELDGPMRHTVADIGSNDRGFWFWVENKKEPVIYVCDHKDLNSCQLAVTLQPDWIIEAMGLRRFSDDEARKIHAKAGDAPGTLVLTQLRKDARGQVYTKETLVNEAEGRILEHKLYLGAKAELIASATVSLYTKVSIEAPAAAAADADPAAESGPTVVFVPKQFRLNWVKENFGLEIAMAGLKVNPSFPKDVRAELFAEPKIPGTTKRDLAQLDLNAAPASSRVYESRPIPQSRGIRLGSPQPSPIDAGGTTRRAIDPVPLSADLSSTPAQPAGIVGAMVPTADGYGGQPADAGRWRSPTLAR